MRRLVLLESVALVLGLTLVEAAAILGELRVAVIRDWFVALAPLLWVNVSVFVLYLFFRSLSAADEEPGREPESPTGRWHRLLWPDFGTLRRATKDRRFLLTWIGAGSVYAVTYMLLQGMLIVDPAGGLPPLFAILESPVGYGPGLVWSPHPSVGILLRPYAAAAAVALSVLAGLVLALFLVRVGRGREGARALPSAVAGMGVLCPTCFATPAAGLAVAYAAPAVALAGAGSVPLFSVALAMSSALLLVSLLLLWATASWLSRLP